MTNEKKYTVHGVLAGAYAGKNPKLESTLTHLSVAGEMTALCKRVKPDSLCDEEEPGAPTCPRCAKLAAKLLPGHVFPEAREALPAQSCEVCMWCRKPVSFGRILCVDCA